MREHVRQRIMSALQTLFAVLLLTLAVASRPASAQSMDEAAAQLAANEFASTSQALRTIAASGALHAPAMLDAMLQNRFFVDSESKSAFYEETPGVFKSARDGAPLAQAPAKRDRLRINNRIRREVADILGALRLMAPDPAARIRAAETIFRSRQEDALPGLNAALKSEKNAAVRARFEQARAAILISRAGSSEQERVDAILVLQARGDQLALANLRNVPASAPQAVKDAAAAAAKKIEDRIALLAHAQNVWYGLSLGSVLLLAAIGLAITFGVMGVINMAHGEMVMLGAYTTFVVQELCRAFAPGMLDWSIPIALPLAFLVTALVGIAIERGVISFLYGRPLETLLATWGVSLVLQQAVRTAFGPTNREVSAPSYMSGAFDVMGMSITYGRLWIIVFTLVLFLALLAAMKLTRLGLYIRAVTQNRRMAAAMGIRTPWIDAMTFGLGSGLAGLAGVALSQIDNVSPNLGQSYIIDSFMVVVFGGVGNLWGTLVSAFTLGIANKFLEPVTGAVLGKILILVLLILFIQKRPRGLFALRGRAVES